MNPLVNKFVFVDSGETYRTGKITAEIDGHFFLVQFDNMTDKTEAKCATPVCLHEMSVAYDDDGLEIKSWSFYDTREELQKFIDWIDAPAEPEVVKLIPKSKPSKATH
jgi:hypothetical protein